MADKDNWAERTYDDDDASLQQTQLDLYLVVIHGDDCGRRIKLDQKPVIVGRAGGDADVPLSDGRASGRHCRITRTPAGVLIEDLESRNGTFIDNARIAKATLAMGSQLRIGRTLMHLELKSDAEILREEELFKAATTDALTRVPNRRYFFEQAAGDVSLSLRHNTPMCLAILDADHFKKINDTHGHQAGDYVLVTLAAILQNEKRTEDLLCRYGGEEFLLLLRATPADAAKGVCERIRTAIMNYEFKAGAAPIPVTVSLGLSVLRPNDTLEVLVKRADEALYRAKEGGRNRVELEAPGPSINESH